MAEPKCRGMNYVMENVINNDNDKKMSATELWNVVSRVHETSNCTERQLSGIALDVVTMNYAFIPVAGNTIHIHI